MPSPKATKNEKAKQAPKRTWEEAGPGYPGVYVSSVKPAEVVKEKKSREWYNELLREYHLAAHQLDGLDDA